VNLARFVSVDGARALKFHGPLAGASNISQEGAARVEYPDESSLPNPVVAVTVDNYIVSTSGFFEKTTLGVSEYEYWLSAHAIAAQGRGVKNLAKVLIIAAFGA